MPVQSICLTCGAAFATYPSRLRGGIGRYCSARCSHAPRVPVAMRFWAKVGGRDPNGCWLWLAATQGGGYGVFKLGNKNANAHRMAWELVNGPIPPEMFVCHRCDRNYPPGDVTYRRCVNPGHLFLATHADNMRDRNAKGRQASGDRSRVHPERRPRGEAHASAKLTADTVRAIRQHYASGTYTYAQLARRFGVGIATIQCAVVRRSWAHIP